MQATQSRAFRVNTLAWALAAFLIQPVQAETLDFKHAVDRALTQNPDILGYRPGRKAAARLRFGIIDRRGACGRCARAG